MKAVENGDKDLVTFLTDHGANVAIKDKYGYTALHKACIIYHDCSPEVLSCLIENGADVNLSTDNNLTPLMTACEYGHVNTVTILIEHGANVNLQDRDGLAAVHYAVRGSQACEILSCLMEDGADVDAKTFDNCTPLMIAAQRGDTKVATFLIEQGAMVNLQDKDGNAALHYAIQENSGSHKSNEVLDYLIQIGADVNAQSNEGRTPLMKAIEFAEVTKATFLIEQGANMNLQDKSGDTALHYAVRTDSPEITDSILTLGASCMCNNRGLTPLLLASSTGRSEVVEEFIKRSEITKEERADALELLGASIFTTNGHFERDIEMGFKYIKRGMEERFANPSQPLVKPTIEPVEAYHKRKESQTLEELALIENNIYALLMESLIIRERILGKENADLLYQIRLVASFYSGSNDPSTCISLCRHAFKIAQSSNVSSTSDLYCISENLLKRNHPPEQKEVIELLEQTVLEYKKQNTEKIRRKPDVDLFLCSEKLISIIAINGFCGDSNASHASILLQKLCRQDSRDAFGNTLLHFFVKHYIPDNSFPLLDVLKLLLNAGFDVNAVNEKGDTPLHLAVTLKAKQNKFSLLTGVMETLFNGGAHHDFVNNKGKTPMDMAKTDEARMILSEKRKLELKCISARAVKKFRIPYLGVVPKTLEKYVSMH